MSKLDKPIIHFKFPADTIACTATRAFINDVVKMLDGKAYVLATTADMQVIGTEHLNIDVEKCSVSELFKILNSQVHKNNKRKNKTDESILHKKHEN